MHAGFFITGGQVFLVTKFPAVTTIIIVTPPSRNNTSYWPPLFPAGIKSAFTPLH